MQFMSVIQNNAHTMQLEWTNFLKQTRRIFFDMNVQNQMVSVSTRETNHTQNLPMKLCPPKMSPPYLDSNSWEILPLQFCSKMRPLLGQVSRTSHDNITVNFTAPATINPPTGGRVFTHHLKVLFPILSSSALYIKHSQGFNTVC